MLSDELKIYDELGIDTNSYVVNIFDFDGTIYRSPSPNKKRLGRKMTGRLMSTIQDKGLGWFQNTVTLEPRYTTELGDFFIKDVIKDVRKSMSDPKAKTILLTGRTVAYLGHVKAILDTLEEPLVFDEYILKPLPSSTYKESTGKFKNRIIDELVTRYNATEVNMWEDREKHVKAFTRHLENHDQVTDWDIHHIVDDSNYLPADYEDEVIEKLKSVDGICESAKNMEVPTPRPTYHGVVIDGNSRNQLLATTSQWVPKDWKVIAHHMTIIFGDKSRNQFISGFIDRNLNNQVSLQVTHWGLSDDAFAVKVYTGGIPCDNKVPHITIAIPVGGKAVNSNYIDQWNELDQSLVVTGTITAIY